VSVVTLKSKSDITTAPVRAPVSIEASSPGCVGWVYTVSVSTGVAQVNVPSPSDLKNCVVVPLPVTFKLPASTTLSVIIVAPSPVDVTSPV